MPVPTSPGELLTWKDSAAIEAEIDLICNDPDFCTYATKVLIGQTYQGKNIYGIRIHHTGTTQALMIGGLHARELAPPETLLSYANVLLAAFTQYRPIRYQRLRMTYADKDSEFDGGYTGEITLGEAMIPLTSVLSIMSNIDLYIIPCVNLDGRDFALTPELDAEQRRLKRNWRTNRHLPSPLCSSIPGYSFGIDLNRNFPTTSWNRNIYYAHDPDTQFFALEQTTLNQCQSTGLFPLSQTRKKKILTELRQTYPGPSANSESETQALVQFINSHKFQFFLDIHSNGRQIMYPWGSHHNQSDDPSQSFLNTSYDYNTSTSTGGREFGPDYNDSQYHEYMPKTAKYDLGKALQLLACRMQNSIYETAGEEPHAQNRSFYTDMPLPSLYASQGSCCDYIMEKNLKLNGNQVVIDTSKFPIHAIAIECGHPSDGFDAPRLSTGNPGPQNYQYAKVEREVHFAISSFLTYGSYWQEIYDL